MIMVVCVLHKKMAKTYNSGDSLVVTHLTTDPPVHCLYMAERTGSLVLSVLWSYVRKFLTCIYITPFISSSNRCRLLSPLVSCRLLSGYWRSGGRFSLTGLLGIQYHSRNNFAQ